MSAEEWLEVTLLHPVGIDRDGLAFANQSAIVPRKASVAGNPVCIGCNWCGGGLFERLGRPILLTPGYIRLIF
jgi:hypothetical protein